MPKKYKLENSQQPRFVSLNIVRAFSEYDS